MPLSQQLKSEMTGLPVEKLPEKEDENPVPESENFDEFDDSNSSDGSAPEEDAAPTGEICSPESDKKDLLSSIERKLQELNDNILGLGKTTPDNQSPDYREVIEKIASIEELLSTKIIDSAEKTESVNGQIMRLLQDIFERQEYNGKKLMQSLRENANFQVQVRQGMQHDLDELKEQISGEQFTPILKEIATTYVEYQSILDDENISAPSRKNLKALFEQLEDILNDYGAEVFRSEIGSVRQTRTCKVIEKITTGQQEKHNTIAKSRKPGVIRDRVVLYPEFVDVFVYDPALAEEAENNIEETAENEDTAAVESDEKEQKGAENAASDNDKSGGNE